jgi:hypothetical protein
MAIVVSISGMVLDFCLSAGGCCSSDSKAIKLPLFHPSF